MPKLTPEGLRAVSEVAARHGFSVDAALAMVDSLFHGQGSQAQFNHPEFGGMGQWSRGGMIMIGDMFNHELKYRVDALCNDLCALLGEQPSIHAPAQSFQSQSQGGGYSVFASGGSSWWPQDLGQPASSGAQNDMSYAFFPASRRLAIQQGGRVRVYDSGDHQLSGFSQQQGGGQSLTFNSQYGTVRVSELPVISGDNDAVPAPSSRDIPTQSEAQSARSSSHSLASAPESSYASTPAPQGAALSVADILKTIKDLAALRQEGVLTEEEFAAKKTELLKRI